MRKHNWRQSSSLGGLDYTHVHSFVQINTGLCGRAEEFVSIYRPVLPCEMPELKVC